MKDIKRIILHDVAYLFTFLGAAAIIKPMCMGWFYQPEIPEALKELKDERG
jgi:cyclic lactone autoinducer peptide